MQSYTLSGAAVASLCGSALARAEPELENRTGFVCNLHFPFGAERKPAVHVLDHLAAGAGRLGPRCGAVRQVNAFSIVHARVEMCDMEKKRDMPTVSWTDELPPGRGFAIPAAHAGAHPH